jgi:hypothetical protein
MGWIHNGIDDGEPHPQYALGVGSREEIGANEGMQSGPGDMVGARQLQALRRALGTNLQQRYGSHQPATKNVPSQYRDSGQISINVSSPAIAVSSSTFLAGGWNNVSVTGASTVYTSFKPNRIVLTEQIIATFSTSALGTVIVAGESDTAADIMLSGAFSGSLNTFPNAPSATTGIHGPAIAANAFGVGISWPTVNSGIPVTANFLVLQTALFRVAAPTPFSTTNLTSFFVNIFLAMFGPQLR